MNNTDRALDNHITGHYGDDQYPEDGPDEVDCGSQSPGDEAEMERIANLDPTPNPKLVTALRIHEARMAKAHKMADLLAVILDQADPITGIGPKHIAASLKILDDTEWLKLAQKAGAAGPSGVDTPSLETRAMVIAEVKRCGQ